MIDVCSLTLSDPVSLSRQSQAENNNEHTGDKLRVLQHQVRSV